MCWYIRERALLKSICITVQTLGWTQLYKKMQNLTTLTSGKEVRTIKSYFIYLMQNIKDEKEHWFFF